MDDILLFLNKSEDWDHERFINDFEESTCYWKPLNLEATEAGTFLESTISKVGDDITFRLKNQNEFGNKIWRYHDYRSRLDYTTKRAIIISTLRKVDKMASDDRQRVMCAKAKCLESARLGYPMGILRHMCSQIVFDSGNPAWIGVRNSLPSPSLLPPQVKTNKMTLSFVRPL